MRKIIAILLSAIIVTAAFFVSCPLSLAVKEEDTVISLDVLDEKRWKGLEGIANIVSRKASGKKVLSASAEEGTTRISLRCDMKKVDLADASELVIELYVRSGAEKSDLSVLLKFENYSYTYDTVVSSNEATVRIPLESDADKKLVSMTLTLDAGESHINYLMLLSATADDHYTYSYTERFSSPTVLSSTPFERSEDSMTLYFEDGVCDATLSFLESYTWETNTCAWISFDCSYDCTLTARAVYPDGDEQVAASQNVTGSGTYSFVLRGGYEKVTFAFSSVKGENASVKLTGAGVCELDGVSNNAGTVNSCRYDGKRIVVEGSLFADASVAYYGAKLLLYAIPAAEASGYDIADYKPCAQTGFSTIFSLSCAFDASALEYFFAVYLDADNSLVPVDDICCVNGGYAPDFSKDTVYSLAGADSVDAFEANASSVIIDVAVDELLETEDIYSAISYLYRKNYYFNRAAVERLDSEFGFCTSAGIDVYLRVCPGGDGKVRNASEIKKAGVSEMCAVLGFLSERYGTAAGFIMGKALNVYGYDDPSEWDSAARLVSVFCETVKSKAPLSCVILPFSDSEASNAHVSASLLYYYLGKYNCGSTVSLFEVSGSTIDALDSAVRLSSISSAYTGSSDGTGIIWIAPEDREESKISADYKKLCADAKSFGVRFAALHTGSVKDSKRLYTALRASANEGRLSRSQTLAFPATEENKSFRGAYSFWDFTSSYDTSGWVSGGAFEAPVTARGVDKTRVLSAKSAEKSAGDGVLIGKFISPVDMSNLYARVSLNVLSEKSETAQVTVIFAGGDLRAEYTAQVKCNKPSEILCDMYSLPASSLIDHAALIVRGAEGAEVQLSRVDLFSTTKDDAMLYDQLKPVYEKEENPAFYGAVIISAAVTVAIFSVLVRKKRRGTGYEQK